MSTAHFVSGPGVNGTGDVIFVHGLDGDPFDTWAFNSQESWTSWLAADRADLNLWSIEYEASSTAWYGSSIPLTDRAINVLATIDAAGVGARPLCFIAHSMGGLLVKQLLRHARTFATEYEHICAATRGVVYLSTPHAGSDVATLVSYLRFALRSTVAVADLEAHAPALRELNLWYRNNVAALDIASKIFWETQKTGGLAVVNATSADPGIAGVTPIPIDADHSAICKPRSRQALQYLQTLKFLNDRLPDRPAGRSGYFSAQRDIIHQHAARFVGRARVLHAFDAFLTARDRGYFIVEGPPGQGKTALASHIVQHHGCPHHFIRQIGGRADDRLVLSSLLAQLPGVGDTAGRSESAVELVKTFEDAIRRYAATSNHPVVVVIDALDELGDNPDGAQRHLFLLTEAVPPNLYFLVTARPGRQLDSLRAQLGFVPTQSHQLEPLAPDEIRALVSAHGVQLSDMEHAALVEASAGNALYIEAAARTLAEGNAFDSTVLPPAVEGFFRHATRELTTNAVLRGTLGVLAVTRNWMTARQLATVIGVSERQVVEEGLQPIRHFLQTNARAYAFYHESFHAFVTRELLYSDEIRQYHRQFAALLTKPPRDLAEYRLSSLAHHLAASDDAQGLERHVDAPFLAEKVRALGYAVLEDIELLARTLFRRQDPAVVEKCVRLVDSLRDVGGADLVGDIARSAQFGHLSVEASPSRAVEPPLETIPQVDAHALIIPKGRVSADFVEFVRRDNRLFVAIGDAPSSGLKSAFVARFVATALRTLVERARPVDPGGVLGEINQTIAAHGYFERISMLCLELSPADGIVAIANAGHPFPVLYSSARRQCDVLPVRGPLLRDIETGHSDASTYDVRHAEIGAGDVLVLVSDGLTEWGRLDDDQYGYRFVSLIEQHPRASARQLCQLILQDWQSHARDAEWIDDVAIVVLVVKSPIRVNTPQARPTATSLELVDGSASTPE